MNFSFLNQRRYILKELINFKKDLKDLKKSLENIEWDSAKSLVVLRTEHLINLLNKFLSNQMDEVTLEEWANLIEGRDDITYTNDIKDIIHYIANPDLNEPLTFKQAQYFIKKLSNQ